MNEKSFNCNIKLLSIHQMYLLIRKETRRLISSGLQDTLQWKTHRLVMTVFIKKTWACFMSLCVISVCSECSSRQTAVWGRETCFHSTTWQPSQSGRHYHNINIQRLWICLCLISVGWHLILTWKRNATGAAPSLNKGICISWRLRHIKQTTVKPSSCCLVKKKGGSKAEIILIFLDCSCKLLIFFWNPTKSLHSIFCSSNPSPQTVIVQS